MPGRERNMHEFLKTRTKLRGGEIIEKKLGELWPEKKGKGTSEMRGRGTVVNMGRGEG